MTAPRAKHLKPSQQKNLLPLERRPDMTVHFIVLDCWFLSATLTHSPTSRECFEARAAHLSKRGRVGALLSPNDS